jgi:dihydroorotate dehydrogenase (NAD+) catalytic subunit
VKNFSASDKSVLSQLPRYDIQDSYESNYENSPEPQHIDLSAVSGKWSFCGLPVPSPLGIPAGPLLNGRWVLYYASLGFDVLTYKTVRSQSVPCYGAPNLVPVECGQLDGSEFDLPMRKTMDGSWAVSFGMPSRAPDQWRADVEETRRQLAQDKLLSVSVVATQQEDWSMQDLANDYAQCAKWAVERGADCVETNFSCPNVSTCDGQLYQDADNAALVASVVKEQIGNVPYILKIGRIDEPEKAAMLLEAVHPFVNAIALTNSLATTVVDRTGQPLFDGKQRGICGDGIRTKSVAQVRMMADIIRQHNYDIELIGVGGVNSASHVRQYLEAGAQAVHLATAVMVEPRVGLQIREELGVGIQA